MGQIKNIKLHIVTDIKNVFQKYFHFKIAMVVTVCMLSSVFLDGYFVNWLIT